MKKTKTKVELEQEVSNLNKELESMASAFDKSRKEAKEIKDDIFEIIWRSGKIRSGETFLFNNRVFEISWAMVFAEIGKLVQTRDNEEMRKENQELKIKIKELTEEKVCQ